MTRQKRTYSPEFKQEAIQLGRGDAATLASNMQPPLASPRPTCSHISPTATIWGEPSAETTMSTA